jgi:hypothetical protein
MEKSFSAGVRLDYTLEPAALISTSFPLIRVFTSIIHNPEAGMVLEGKTRDSSFSPHPRSLAEVGLRMGTTCHLLSRLL